MSGPKTRGLDDPCELDAYPSAPIALAEVSSNVHQNNSRHFNSWGPWLAVVGSIAGLALGLAIGSVNTANQARAVIDSVASDAKRIAEREARLTQVQVDDLKSQLRAQGFKIQNHELP